MNKNISKEKIKAQYLRDRVFEIVSLSNNDVPLERQVTKLDALTVVQRSLEKTIGLPNKERDFKALRDLSDFITLSQKNKTSFSNAKNTDLLPIGHPKSTASHDYSLQDYLTQKARWITADFNIVEEAKPLIASAIINPCDSVEYKYAITRLTNLPQGLVSQEALLAAIGDGNSTLARRARAAKQLRDKLGRFAWMGGGVRAFFRMLNGDVKSFSGRYVADSPKPGFIQVEAPDESIYEIPSTSSEFVKALINPTADGFSPASAKYSESDPIVDLSSANKVEAPNGWTRIDPNNPLGFTDGAFNAVISRDVNGKRKLSVSTVDGTSVGDFDNWFEIQNQLRGREVDLAGLARNEDGSEFDDVENRWTKYPEGAYKLNRFVGYLPQGIEDGVEGATDNPKELALKFNKADLVGALEEALLPIESVPANGRGLLGFEGGLQDIKAEAIYQALRMQGEDADSEVARIYDGALGTTENQDALNAEREENRGDVSEEIARLDLGETVTPEAKKKEQGELPPLLQGLTDSEKADLVGDDGVGDYRPYLPVNEAFEMPEGYYTPNISPIDPTGDFINIDTADDSRVIADITGVEYPIGYTNDPYIATRFDEDALKNAFRSSLEPSETPGYGSFSFINDEDESIDITLPSEVLRDALQLKGVDTNAILREVAEEGRAGQVKSVDQDEARDILDQEGAETPATEIPRISEEEVSRLRNLAVVALANAGYDENLQNAVKDGKSYEEVKNLLDSTPPTFGYPSRWAYDVWDYENRHWVDLPRAAQRSGWAQTEAILNYLAAVKPEDNKTKSELTPITSEVLDAATKRLAERIRIPVNSNDSEEIEIREDLASVTAEKQKQIAWYEETLSGKDLDEIRQDLDVSRLREKINQLNKITAGILARLNELSTKDVDQDLVSEGQKTSKIEKQFSGDLANVDVTSEQGAEDAKLITNDLIENSKNPRNELPINQDAIQGESKSAYIVNAGPGDLQKGDIITKDHFVITDVIPVENSIGRDRFVNRRRPTIVDSTPTRVIIRGYYPGHEEQAYPEQITSSRQLRVIRGAEVPESGSAGALNPPNPQDYLEGRRDPDFVSEQRSWRREVLSAKRGFTPPSDMKEFIWTEDVELKNSFMYRFVMYYNRNPQLFEKLQNLVKKLEQVGGTDSDSAPSDVTPTEKSRDVSPSNRNSLDDQIAKAKKEYEDLEKEIRQMLLAGVTMVDPRIAELTRLRDEAFNRMLGLRRQIDNQRNVSFVEPTIKVISINSEDNKPKQTPSTQKINEDPRETIPTPENTGSVEIEIPSNQDSWNEFAQAYWEEMMQGVASTEPMPEDFPDTLRNNFSIPRFNTTPQDGAILNLREIEDEEVWAWENPDGTRSPVDFSNPEQAGSLEVGRVYNPTQTFDLVTTSLTPTPIENLQRDSDGNISIPTPPGSTPSTPPPTTQNINIPENDIRRERFNPESGEFTSGEPASRVTEIIPTPNFVVSDSDRSPFTLDGFRQRIQSLLDARRRPMKGDPYRVWQEDNFVFADGINQARRGDVVNHWGGEENEFRGWGDGTIVALEHTLNPNDRLRRAYAWVYFPQAVIRDDEGNLVLDENGQPQRGPIFKKLAVRMLFLNNRGSISERRAVEDAIYNDRKMRRQWQRIVRADRERDPNPVQALPREAGTPTPTPTAVRTSTPTPTPTPTPQTDTPEEVSSDLVLPESTPIAERFINRPLESRNPAGGVEQYDGSIKGVKENNPDYVDPDRFQVDGNDVTQQDYISKGWSAERAAKASRAAKNRPSLKKLKELVDRYNSVTTNDERIQVKIEIEKALNKIFGAGTATFGRGDYSLSIDDSTIGNERISFNASVKNENGIIVGRTSRSITLSSDKTYINESILVLNTERAKGSGFGEAWKAYYDAWAIANGVDYSETQAAGGGNYIGAYVWSGFGYGWSNVSTGWNIMQGMSLKVDTLRRKPNKSLQDLIIIRDFDYRVKQAADALNIAPKDLFEASTRRALNPANTESILQSFPTPRDLALIGLNPFDNSATKWFGKDFMIKNGWYGKKRYQPDNVSLLQQEAEAYEYKRRRDNLTQANATFESDTKLKKWFSDIENYPDDLKPYFDEISTMFKKSGDVPVSLLSPPARRSLQNEVFKLLSPDGEFGGTGTINREKRMARESLVQVLDALNRDRLFFENPAREDSVIDRFRNVSLADLESFTQAYGFDASGPVTINPDVPLILGGEDSGLLIKRVSGTTNPTFKITDPSSGKVYYIKKQIGSRTASSGARAELIANQIGQDLEILGLPLIQKIGGEDNEWIIQTNAGGNLNVKPLDLDNTSATVDAGSFSIAPADWTEGFDAENVNNIEATNLINIAVLDTLISNEDRHGRNSLMVENPQEGSSSQSQRWQPVPIDNADNVFNYNYDTITRPPASVEMFLKSSFGDYISYLASLGKELGPVTLKALVDKRLQVLRNNLRKRAGGGYLSQEQLDLLNSRIDDFESLTESDYQSIINTQLGTR